ncbi:polysaccharide biosynthesis protein, partial [Salinivibrio proteolyticus]|uniref:lipopolysaccharide biosynthesis protein n=1 Tax=Salinivibrio proteolyticus TaxID=334715 RepID=UPI0009CBF0F2
SKMAKETFLLSLPLILLYFQNIFFAYIDRILLQYYFDSSIVGVYTLGYILGQAISTVYSAVSQAVLPKVYDDFKDNYQEGISSFEVFSYKYYAVLLILTFVVSLLSPVILKIVSNENYYEAHKVMPFILGGFMMAGLYKVPAMVLSFHKVVWVYPLVSMCSFGFKILLSWYFIPTDGMLGAAFSTFVGLFLYSVILQIICVRHFNKKYAIVVFGGYMLILMIATLAFSTGVSSIY